ncbi:MAG TPA: MFS transporter [Anaerohalosphaeraceae bacterium]|nr:MFS transporter [Anaerohalosphaeraceae bacterium]HPB93733.1 MFS transporter [Anaerohalosphaeraceae bacterium]HRT24144.1 MFS transporter [Anaerohalosphaeraceae bacterium]HRU15783.1 MFS transporter [Anaerohalosphaeraceae bacterium]
MNTSSLQDKTLDRRRRLQTMRLSILEGLLAMIAIGLQQTFYVPFLNALGATKFEIGIGSGLPALMTGLIQLRVPHWIQNPRYYKPALFWSTFLHGLSFFPLALVIYLRGPVCVWAAMAVMAVSAAAMGFGSGIWADWMGHIVPRRRRGTYFGNRNRLLTLSQLAASVIAGYCLDTSTGKTLLIFACVWTTGGLARTVSSFLFFRHHEPTTLRQESLRPGLFRDFCRQIFHTSFGNFVVAYSLIQLANNFSSPFFTLYMLNEMKLSYIRYTCLSQMPTLITLLSMPLWGRICDRIGYVRPMRLQVTIVFGLPLVWILTHNYWILMGVQVLSGLSWGGLTLASFNYSINSLPHQSRLSGLSYLNFISSVFIFLGTTLGGWVGPMLPTFSSSQLHSIFLFSTILRTVPVLLFQMLPEDAPPQTKLSTIERFFFDPRMALRAGFDHIISTKFRRPF